MRPAPGRRRPPVQAVALFVGLLATACATPGAAVFPGNLPGLAGTWEGWIDHGPGMSRTITVVIQADGAFRGVDARGSVFAGVLRPRAGTLHWTGDVAGSAGTAKVYREGRQVVIRGSRTDGSTPFEWRRAAE
jgi:hypothetical protein